MPREMLTRVFTPADLAPHEALRRRTEERLHGPDCYRLKFSPAEAEAVRERTAIVASRFDDA
jgi:hypothetical protein